MYRVDLHHHDDPRPEPTLQRGIWPPGARIPQNIPAQQMHAKVLPAARKWEHWTEAQTAGICGKSFYM